MFKRVTIVALVVAAFLVLAVPALAFNGMRENYSVATSCQGCHTNGNFGAPKVFDAWAETKHAENEAYTEVKDRVPTGSVCQGCHTANFDPAKMTPTPTATTTAYSTPVGPTSVADRHVHGLWLHDRRVGIPDRCELPQRCLV